MSRYIDVDNAFETFKSLPRCENGFSDTYDIETIIGILQDEPIVDAVEVVRCKECINARYWYGDNWLCDLWSETGIKVFGDEFCSYGEKVTE